MCKFADIISSELKRIGSTDKIVEVPIDCRPTEKDLYNLNEEIQYKIDKNHFMMKKSEIFSQKSIIL